MLVIPIAEGAVFDTQGAAIVVRERVGATGVIDKYRAPVRVFFRFLINSIRWALINAIVAGFAVLLDPIVEITVVERQIFDVGKDRRQADAGAVTRGNEQAVFSGHPQASIYGQGDIVHIAANGRSGLSVVAPLPQEICHLVDDQTQLPVGAEYLDERGNGRSQFDFVAVHFHGEDDRVPEEDPEAMEDVAGIDSGVSDVGDAQTGGIILEFSQRVRVHGFLSTVGVAVDASSAFEHFPDRCHQVFSDIAHLPEPGHKTPIVDNHQGDQAGLSRLGMTGDGVVFLPEVLFNGEHPEWFPDLF